MLFSIGHVFLLWTYKCYREKSKFMKKPKRINIFEIPQEVISNDPKLTIVSFNKMLIENYKGILEYEDFFIRISTILRDN